jgi:hypothetical protein
MTTPPDGFRRHGLYYPFFHVRHDRWLKVAALYWPKIVRIVPDGYPTRDSTTAQALADEDFLVRQPPGKSVETVAPLFLDLVARHAEALRTRFPVQMHQEYSSFQHLNHDGQQLWTAVHVGEMTREVEEALIDAGLCAHRGTTVSERWINAEFGPAPEGQTWVVMHPGMVAAYTSVLAEDFATANLLRPTTDQAESFVVANNWTTDRLAEALLTASVAPRRELDYLLPDHDDLSAWHHPHQRRRLAPSDLAEAMGFLALDLVVPDDLDDVPVSKIIEVRRRYGEEFRAFGASLEQAATDLAELTAIRDQEALERYLKDEIAHRFTQPMNVFHPVVAVSSRV